MADNGPHVHCPPHRRRSRRQYNGRRRREYERSAVEDAHRLYGPVAVTEALNALVDPAGGE
jgi:hypothetical protein